MVNPQGKYAWTARVGEKGQIVIPKEARDVFDIHPGDTLILLGDEKQGIAVMKSELLAQITSDFLNTKQDEKASGTQQEVFHGSSHCKSTEQTI